MSRKHSPIIEMYGTTPPPDPPREKGYVWQVILLAAAGLFVYKSIRPVMRLRPDPPALVMGSKLNLEGAGPDSQERMARACWDYAIQYLEASYPFGESLPSSPNLGDAPVPELRVRCWPRLRRAWTQDESWIKSYQWSTDWLTDPQGSLRQTLRRFWNGLRIR